MIDTGTINHLAERITTLVPPEFEASRGEFHASVRAMLARTLRDWNVVSRDEFDAQARVLEQTRKRLAALEWRIAAMEARLAQQ